MKFYIRQQLQNGELVPLKSEASERNLPADDFVLTEITRHMQSFAEGPERLLITNRCRRPVQRSSFGTCWREAVANAKLPKGTTIFATSTRRV
jgi:hypothetical protein